MTPIKMNHTQRMKCVLEGGKPDIIPVAFWRHFPLDDQNPERLAQAAINFQETFNFDFVKVSPASSFMLRDYGVEDSWQGNTEGTRTYHDSIINHIDDLEKIRPLDPQKGSLGNQLACLKNIVDHFSPETPVIQTVFNPLSQLKNLLGKKRLPIFVRSYPEKVKQVLALLTRTTNDFILACLEMGADGIFYAVQHATANIFSKEEFIEFGKYYDLQVCESTQKFWINILHIHGDQIYFKEFLQYPFQIINWHDRETKLDLLNGTQFFNKCVCGGLNRTKTMVIGTQQEIRLEIEDAVAQTNQMNFVLGTGCVLPIITPFGNIRFAVDTIRSLSV